MESSGRKAKAAAFAAFLGDSRRSLSLLRERRLALHLRHTDG
jgi:hypothetical protein